MKVFLLRFCDYDSPPFESIWSTRELAEERARALCAKYPPAPYESGFGPWGIMEVEVDRPDTYPERARAPGGGPDGEVRLPWDRFGPLPA